MTIPQLIISLSPQGELITELPSLNGSRRKINLKINQTSLNSIETAIEILRQIGSIPATNAANDLSTLLKTDNTLTDILLRILENQVSSKHKIGEDGNPTEQQVRHWQKHNSIWGDPMCPFCISEGKFEKGKNLDDNRKLRGLSEYEALRLGLISRGYKEIIPKQETKKFNPKTGTMTFPPTKPLMFQKQNMGNIFLFLNTKILDYKKVEWSKEEKNLLIKDGKAYAKVHGFISIKSSLKRSGCEVKKQVKLVKETQVEKIRRKMGKLRLF